MLPPKLNLPAPQRRLLALFSSLGEQDRSSLLAFAEFLAARAVPAAEPMEAQEPRLVPRPDRESVIAAIRRLSEGYHMLDKSQMLHETSALMSAHVLQGKPAAEVIDELESLFVAHFERYRAGRDG
jgi:hypothetical protein